MQGVHLEGRPVEQVLGVIHRVDGRAVQVEVAAVRNDYDGLRAAQITEAVVASAAADTWIDVA